MLLDKIDQATQIIIEAKESTDIASQNTKLDSLIQELTQIYTIQNQLIEKKRSLINHKMKDVTKLNVYLYKKQIIELEKRLKDEIPPPHEFKSTRIELQNVSKELDTAWQEYVRFDTASVNTSLKIIKGIANEKDKITKIVYGLATIGKANFEGEESFRKLNVLIDEGKNIIEALGLNTEIQQFLKKALKGTATIRDLKPEIIEWIQEHELEDSVKIGF